MLCQVYVKSYAPPKINVKEILRYAGVKEEIVHIQNLIDECLEEIKDKLNFKVCFIKTPVKVVGDNVDLGFTITTSNSLAKRLKNCSSAIVFVSTIGVEIDRLIAKYGIISPSKALIFQAIGSERVESLCDAFNDDIAKEYKFVTQRFSAGYGDLSIQLQREIFALLDCYKKIGVALNDSLLMSPSKSVTAIIGISNSCEFKDQNVCDICDKSNCEFRRK